jgi:putative nucleotidyltransferase with HDIG domain
VFKVQGQQQTRVRAVWVHSAVAAVFAREIARRLRKNVEGAFLCGLLHDVGRPVVLAATIAALEHRSKEPLPPALLETAMDEFHGPVGERMLESWKLADWTTAVVAHHHEPARAAPHDEEARITRLADLLSHWALDQGRTPADFASDDPVVRELNLYPEDVEGCSPSIRRRSSCEAFQ